VRQPAAESTILSIRARRKSSLGQHLFRYMKSMHIRHFPFFFMTITTLASHCGYATSQMKHASSSLWTSAFTASIFSSDILRSFFFLGFTFGLTWSLCSIISLLTPNEIKGRPRENITVFVKESQELRLFFRT
jgi:hypothetical protein